MTTFLLRRLASGVVLVLIVCTSTYFLLSVLGRDPAAILLGNQATDAQIAVKQAELGLDQPVLSRYLSWLSSALTGDFGASWSNSVPVADSLADRVPITLALCIGATVMSALLGGLLGIAAASRGGSIDRLLQILAIVGYSVPGFWLAQMLSSTFAVQLKILPAIGYTPFAEDPAGWLRSITLPVAALTIGGAASIAQQLRNSIRETVELDFVRTLVSRGIPRRRILFVYVLRNAAPAALTTVALQFIGLLSGAVIVENVFALQGLGQLVTGATSTGDVPVVMGVVAVTVLVVVAVNLVLDVTFGILNPKVRVR